MSHIIAGLYEIQDEIGAGGGGIVFRGRHIRLDKTVVLKADKRKLSIGEEALRREVDLLKGLSHTFIPQVYDFVPENDTVYTVMDYIDGMSLDKVIANQAIPLQRDVIKWACQLLQALIYLHRQPPYGILHGDIKPANIMLRPNGDICLIDFNIALALGEAGAVKVGFSHGYASPEHYGADYARRNDAGTTSTWRRRTQRKNRNFQTDVTELVGISAGRSTVVGNKEILLDVRSDIYSLGATLYHLISGRRPPQDAREVTPLDESVCSREVSAILQKAMAPEPARRYQTAQEMLDAFRNLYKTDRRAVRHRRRMAVSAAVIGATVLCGAACALFGMQQLKKLQESITISEYAQNSLAEGDAHGAAAQALGALDIYRTPEAQKALTDALGVYDLSDGFKPLERISLPSAPFGMAMSPQRTRIAVAYAYEAAVFDLETQRRLAAWPLCESALADVLFLDEDTIICAGKQGVTAYRISNNEMLWTEEEATALAVSGDHRVVAAVNRDAGYASIYDAVTGEKRAVCDFCGRHMDTPVNDIFADAGDTVFALNGDGSLLAVSFSDGSLSIFDVYDAENELIIAEENEGTAYGGGFYQNYFAFSQVNGPKSLFGLIDVEEAAYIGGMESADCFVVAADESGVCLANANLLVRIDVETSKEQELAYISNGNITAYSVGASYVLVAADDNSFAFYDSGANLLLSEKSDEPCEFVMMAGDYAVMADRTQKDIRLMKLENHNEAQLLSYDARYAHDEARVSHDRKTAVLFSYKGFRVYDMDGGMLAEVALPDADHIYDQQFVRKEDMSCLEVIWYDGMMRRYSAADGSLISEEKREAPAKDLYEEFYTNQYRFESDLHNAPRVYDIKSGRYVTELEKDAYLTYVTQIGDYIITEYVSAQGDRYGLLLDDRLQKLAYLPNLCDVVDSDTLIFDEKSGNLRQSRLYSIQELMALGESYKNNQ